jgi:hypothetical protein
LRTGSALCLALCSALVAAPAALAAPTATTYASATAGTATPAPAPAAQRTAAVPHAGAATITSAPGSLLQNFNGISSRDSGAVNFGQEFEPPDQGLCVGNGFVVEMVNSAFTVYRPNGAKVIGPFNVNDPFNEGAFEFTTDPRCHYDAATNTWFATVAFISADSTKSHLDVAVNNSGDPTQVWKTYQIDTTSLGGKTGPKHNGCPCFGDQPTLGIDAYNLYVTTNDFSILGPEFNGAQIYAISKSDLVNLSPGPHFVHFDNLDIGGAQAATIQPALTTGNPSAEYFLNALDPNGTFDQRIGVWALTGRSGIANGQKPKLSSLVLTSEAYGIPPSAEQKGSATPIDAGDDRMQQTQYIDGNVWGALGTSVTIPGDPAARAGVAWFKVRPALSGSVLSPTTSLAAQGYLAATGTYLMYPGIQAAHNGTTAMVVSASGKNRYPSAAYSVMPTGATQFGNVRVAAAGTTNYDPNGGRWGDYSWAVLDPSGKSIWMATEYVPPKPSQTADGRRNWGTRVFDAAVK